MTGKLSMRQVNQLKNRVGRPIFCSECSHERSTGHTEWRVDRKRNLLICLQCGNAWKITCSNRCGGVNIFCQNCGGPIPEDEVTCIHCGNQRKCGVCSQHPGNDPVRQVDLRELYKKEVLNQLPGSHNQNLQENSSRDLPGSP